MTEVHVGGEQEVKAAAHRLLQAFATGDMEGYFGSFVPEAVFLFHALPGCIDSTAAYRAAWAGWVRDLDLKVEGCDSFDQKVVLIHPDVALFLHSVSVRVRTSGGPEIRHERETIVFVRQPGGHWLATHEHLSKDPSPGHTTTKTIKA